MKIQAHAAEMLRTLITRARTTGTLADAAIAADYLCKVSGGKYEACMNNLCKRYGIRYAERVCKDRPGMYTAKNPGKDMLPVKFDRATISVTTVKQDLLDSDLFALGI